MTRLRLTAPDVVAAGPAELLPRAARAGHRWRTGSRPPPPAPPSSPLRPTRRARWCVRPARRLRSPAESRNVRAADRACARLPDCVSFLPPALARPGIPAYFSVHGRRGPPRPSQGHRARPGAPGAGESVPARTRRCSERATSLGRRLTWWPRSSSADRTAAREARRRPAPAAAGWPAPRRPETTTARQRGIVAAYDGVLVAGRCGARRADHAGGPARGPRPRGGAVARRARAASEPGSRWQASESEPRRLRPTRRVDPDPEQHDQRRSHDPDHQDHRGDRSPGCGRRSRCRARRG